eukprot:TRINITY_DN63721_c0_g1_i1.p1 TRINITY_DN63721_c0_g1~~TRINITY_DN63721_c0_g1_i1.p1  ORF type:complete len:519 (+),score=76.48 TRINITY_DN63721_c0_g1_i1:88-1644(+)
MAVTVGAHQRPATDPSVSRGNVVETVAASIPRGSDELVGASIPSPRRSESGSAAEPHLPAVNDRETSASVLAGTAALVGATADGVLATSAPPAATAATRSPRAASPPPVVLPGDSRRTSRAASPPPVVVAVDRSRPARVPSPPPTLGSGAPERRGAEAATNVVAQQIVGDASAGTVSGPPPWHWWKEELPQLHPRSGQVMRVWCGVWNLHGKPAPPDISAWLPTNPMHHVYVVGTCECERSIEKSMIWKSKARWEAQVASYLGEDFFMAGAANMSAIHIMVFIHRFLWKYCWDIRTGHVPTGIGNVIGNKGGTQVALKVGHTSMLFVNAHLASSEKKMQERTQNLTRILSDNPQKRSKSGCGIHDEYDRVFLMGDLNPRVGASRRDVDDWLSSDNYAECLARDQLLPLLRADASQADNAGLWPQFEEAVISFPPTYKFDPGSDVYDSGKKQRVPSWTDRILWKRDRQIRSLAYDSISKLMCSDHRPIFSQFEVTADFEKWEGPESRPSKGDSRVCCSQ